MKTLKQGFKMLKYNISSIILFEILCKLFSIAVMTPVIYGLFRYSLKLADIEYLNTNSVGRYFVSPFTYVTVVFILVLVSLHVLLQMSGIIYAFEASYNDRKTNPVLLFIKAIFNSGRVLRVKNIKFGAFVLFILPFVYTIIISATIAGIRVPDFFQVYITQNKTILAVLIVIYILVSWYSMFRIFAINFFTLYKMDYKESVEEGRKLIKGHTFKVLFSVVLLNAIVTVILFGTEWIVVSGTALILKKIVYGKSLSFALHAVIQSTFAFAYIVFAIISTPIIFSYICSSFYMLGGENEEKISKNQLRDEKRETKILKGKRNKVITVIVILLGVLLNGLYIYLDMNNRYKLNFLFDKLPEITAHRGDSAHAPENTMASIRLAVENQADIVEIDVRQTSDGKFVLLHDENLKRTTGYNAKIGSVDYDFVRTIDTGIKFSDDFEGERIPLLDEVLEYARDNDVFLNIELKPTKNDVNYVDGVLNLIDRYERNDSCVIASQDYKLLREVKEKQPEMKTVLILTMAIGTLGDREYADVYSIKYNFITASMVREAHRHGKEVYAWTVNSEETIKKLMLLDVDSIITDKPFYTKDIVYKENENLVTDILKRLIEEY